MFSLHSLIAAILPLAMPAVAAAATYDISIEPAEGESARTRHILYLGDQVKEVRGVLVLLKNAQSEVPFADLGWRALADELGLGIIHLALNRVGGGDAPVGRLSTLGGGRQLLQALERFAVETKHPEIAWAGIVLWGHSFTGSSAATFAAQFPERTIAFCRYRSHLRGRPVEIERIKGVPGFILAGANDQTAGHADSKAFFDQGRALGAPWTFAITPESGQDGRKELTGTGREATVLWSWLRGVVKHRVTADVARGPYPLVPLDPSRAWFGALGEDGVTLKAAAAAPAATYPGNKAAASWLVDDSFAQAWLKLHGAARAEFTYLSDLEWSVAENHRPGWPLKDIAHIPHSEQRSLPPGAIPRQPISLDGVTYAKGLQVAPRHLRDFSTTSYRLNGRYTRFTALVGIDDAVPENAVAIRYEWAKINEATREFTCLERPGATAPCNRNRDGNVKGDESPGLFRCHAGGRVIVRGDGRVLCETPYFYADTPAVKLDLDITGVQTLVIEAWSDHFERATDGRGRPLRYRQGLVIPAAPEPGVYVRKCNWWDFFSLADAKLQHAPAP